MKVQIKFSGLTFHSEYHSAFPRVARSVALFCPYCFSVWASFTETDDLGRLEPLHFAESVPCASHQAWYEWQVPGSLVQREAKFGPAYDLDMLEALPQELLTRELELHIKHWESHHASDILGPSSGVPFPPSPPGTGQGPPAPGEDEPLSSLAR